MAIVLAFGDSITYGNGDPEQGWVQRLRKVKDKNKLIGPGSYDIYNLGISGGNSNTLLQRFEREVKTRLWPKIEIIIIVNIGVNDALFYKDQGKLWVPIEKTEENIQKLIEIAKKYSSKIVFIGPTPVEDAKTNPVYWDSNLFWKDNDIKCYNGVIKKVCNKSEIDFLDIYNHFKKTNYKDLLIDGIHPNIKGHAFLYEIIKDYLEKNKIVEF